MSEAVASVTDRVLRLRADQIDRWGRGEGVRVEDYLAREPGLVDEEAVLELIYNEFVLREELGQAPTPDEYLTRFPQHAEALRRQFEVHALLADPALAEQAPTPSSATPLAVPDNLATPNHDPALTPTLLWPTDVPSTMVEVGGREGESEPVRRVGGYEILGELGHGGMGVVYKALQPGLRRVVALKMIGAQGSGGAEGLARFRGEAEAVARLQHPNIVQVYEVGEHDGLPFVALEYVEGGSLAERLRGTPLPPREAARLLVDLARAMQHAHERGIIHRDLKPANVLLQPLSADSGTRQDNKPRPAAARTDATSADTSLRLAQNVIPKIADFGLAKYLDAERGQTRSGMIMGTPSYMPPEQAEGRQGQIGPATDVYALGAILYEILTGRPPFLAASTLDTLRQVLSEEPIMPSRLARGTPRDLETICLKCLHKDLRKRYPSAAELAADLERYLAGQPVQARRTPAWERAAKWAYRHPAPAALLLGGFLVVVAGLGTCVKFTNSLQTEMQRAEEKRAQEAAAEAKKTNKQLEYLVRSQAAAVKGIAVTTRGAKAVGKEPGEALFDIACGYAATANTIHKDGDLPEKLRRELADQYAESAVYLLTCSEEKAGYFSTAEQRNRLRDPRLKPLHDRQDFKDLLARHHVTLPP
jgi:serine/threonine protein kinase